MHHALNLHFVRHLLVSPTASLNVVKLIMGKRLKQIKEIEKVKIKTN